jgi:hypothetical protein
MRHVRLLAVSILAATCLALTFLAGFAGARTGRAQVYTWPGAVLVHVYSQPEGAGWIRSTPYRIDCPSICTRAFTAGTTVTLTAHPTSGFEFVRWTGPCAGQGNPCEVEIKEGMDEIAAIWAGGLEQ